MQNSMPYNYLFLILTPLESADQIAEGGYHVEERDDVWLPVFVS